LIIEVIFLVLEEAFLAVLADSSSACRKNHGETRLYGDIYEENEPNSGDIMLCVSWPWDWIYYVV